MLVKYLFKGAWMFFCFFFVASCLIFYCESHKNFKKCCLYLITLNVNCSGRFWTKFVAICGNVVTMLCKLTAALRGWDLALSHCVKDRTIVSKGTSAVCYMAFCLQEDLIKTLFRQCLVCWKAGMFLYHVCNNKLSSRNKKEINMD